MMKAEDNTFADHCPFPHGRGAMILLPESPMISYPGKESEVLGFFQRMI